MIYRYDYNNFITMSTANQHKLRAVSAKPPLGRPGSAKNKKMHQKTQFIENVYSNPLANLHPFQKNKVFSMRSDMPENDQEDLSKLIPKSDKIIKDREQLLEENLRLKKEINRLKDELSKNKTKIETLTSKNQKYTKQFNREFEKKIYWNGPNSYMISGIKSQYDKLRQQYEEKSALCEELKHQLMNSGAPQFKIYAENLQGENKKLVERITKMSEISEQILFDNEGEKIIPQYLYMELEKKKQKLNQKYNQSEYKLKLTREQVKEHRRKIEFLEKLIIEKDNAQYHANKKAKKLEREKNLLNNTIQELQNQLEQLTKNSQAKLEKMKQTEERKFQTEKSMFDRTLIDKQIKINKLQKEIAYLSTLLTYWKPLDEINRSLGDKFNDDQFVNDRRSSHQNQNDLPLLNPMEQSKQSRRPSDYGLNSALRNELMMNSKQDLSILQEQQNRQSLFRVQQTADKRHTQEALKKRKVELSQVEHLGEHFRYRLLGLKMPLNEARNYLNFNTNPDKPNSDKKDGENMTWEEEYITMAETIQIFMKYPFELGKDDAYLLARYLIEDSTNEYVYCDLKNQHKRSIVKSILRSLIQQYEILNPDRLAEVEKECTIMMERYHTNLLSALSTTASSGFVSRNKFIEMIKSLGIELSDEGKDYLVSKLLLKSQSLKKLNYMILF